MTSPFFKRLSIYCGARLQGVVRSQNPRYLNDARSERRDPSKLTAIIDRGAHNSHSSSLTLLCLQLRGRWRRMVAMGSRLRTGPPSRPRSITPLAPTARSLRCAAGLPASRCSFEMAPLVFPLQSGNESNIFPSNPNYLLQSVGYCQILHLFSTHLAVVPDDGAPAVLLICIASIAHCET